MRRLSIAIDPRPPSRPAAITNSTLAARESSRCWVGPHANSIWRFLITTCCQSLVNWKSLRRNHQTFSPLCVEELQLQVVDRCLSAHVEADLVVLRERERLRTPERGEAAVTLKIKAQPKRLPVATRDLLATRDDVVRAFGLPRLDALEVV